MAESENEPMWYAASGPTIERRGGPFARRLLRAAPWGAVAIDVMRSTPQPGHFAASPGPRALHDPRWTGTGPDDRVLIAVRAEHPVLTLDGQPLPGDGAPVSVPASAISEGLAWPAGDAGPVLIGLARRVDPAEVLDRRRRSGRIFRPRPIEQVAALPAWAAERPLRFSSNFRRLGPLKGFERARFADIAAEPILRACHPTWVAEHGGPIARAFVASLPDDWQAPGADVIVNAKINEFEPGWYSCLAGWHIDGTSRIRTRSDGSPDLLDPGRTIEQIACNVGAAGATGFLVGEVALPVTPIGEDGRGVWPRILGDAIERGAMQAVRAPIGERVRFGFGDFHTCRVAERPGWRYFIKAMKGRGDVPANALRESSGISWPLRADGVAGHWPDCPLGLFPPTLPDAT